MLQIIIYQDNFFPFRIIYGLKSKDRVLLYTDNCCPWSDAELQTRSRGALDVCPRFRLKAALHRESESNTEARLDLAAFKELMKQRGERNEGVEAEGREVVRSSAQFLERRSKKKREKG